MVRIGASEIELVAVAVADDVGERVASSFLSVARDEPDSNGGDMLRIGEALAVRAGLVDVAGAGLGQGPICVLTVGEGQDA